jgi:uncharacterized damage-inducible protein DinB
MDLRAVDGSPTVRGLFMHMHYCRLVFVHEYTPELGVTVPQGEWRDERDRDRIAARLNQSAEAVRDSVLTRLRSGRPFDDEETGRVTWDVWMEKETWR